MFCVYRTAKPLEWVVATERDLHVFDRSATANTTASQTIDLLIWLQWITGKLDTDIFHDTGVIFRILSTVVRTRTALYLSLASRIIHDRLATKNQATPITIGTRSFRLVGSEHDRFLRRTLGDELSATLDDQGAFRRFLPLDYRSRLDRQGHAIRHIYETSQQVVISSLQGHIRGNLTFQYNILSFLYRRLYIYEIIIVATSGCSKHRGHTESGGHTF